VHEVAASAALAYVPGWQSVHVEAPVVLLAVPRGQAKHTSTVDAQESLL